MSGLTANGSTATYDAILVALNMLAEAACLNASSDDIVNQLRNLFNATI